MLTSLEIGILVVVVSQLVMLLTARPVLRRNYVLSIAVFCFLGLVTLGVCFSQTPTENILTQLLGGRRLQTRSDIAATVLAVGMGVFIGWSIGMACSSGISLFLDRNEHMSFGLKRCLIEISFQSGVFRK